MPGFRLPAARPSFDDPTIRRAQVRVRVVPEFGDEGVTLECGLDDPALDAAPAAVHQPELAQPGFVRGAYVFLDDGRNVRRREGMEIEFRFDRDPFHVSCVYSVFTVVVIPPRTEKAPVTVMRRGRQAATRSSRILLVAAS